MKRRAVTATIVGVWLLALATATAFGVFLVLGRVPTADERRVFLWFTIGAIGAVFLAPSVARRGRGVADRLMSRDRIGLVDPVEGFRAHMTRSLPLDELLRQAVEGLRASMAAMSAEVWVAAGGSLRLWVADPEVARAPLALHTTEAAAFAQAGVAGPGWLRIWMPDVLTGRAPEVRLTPITFSGNHLGALVVERAEPPFTENEERTLIDLARQVGVTMHNAKLDSALHESLDEVRRQAAELQESRARLVAAADQARRQIERNLHDGAQQQVVALALKVGLAKQLIRKDPAKTEELLDQLRGDIEAAVQQLRDLAHGIYPPLLADAGLVEALRSSVRRSVMSVAIESRQIGRYDPELEATMYFCALEAIQNASKYAGEGATVTVTVSEVENSLIVRVTDDGAGFDARGKAMGVGLTNMKDRLGAVGGTLRVESTVGRGTRVTAAVPLAARAKGPSRPLPPTGAG